MLEDLKECNKFQGLRWCAISSKMEVISIKSTPDDAFYDAISQGETCPMIVRGYIVLRKVKNAKKKKSK